MNIALTLKDARTQRGLSQYRLSKISGVAQSIISGIESGNREPTLSVLERLCLPMDIALSKFVAIAVGENVVDGHIPPIMQKLNALDISDQKVVEAMIDSLYSKLQNTADDYNKKNGENVV